MLIICIPCILINDVLLCFSYGVISPLVWQINGDWCWHAYKTAEILSLGIIVWLPWITPYSHFAIFRVTLLHICPLFIFFLRYSINWILIYLFIHKGIPHFYQEHILMYGFPCCIDVISNYLLSLDLFPSKHTEAALGLNHFSGHKCACTKFVSFRAFIQRR